MEVRNSPPESQTSDQSHPIQEIDGEGGSKTAGGPADADGGEGVEAELGNGGGGADMVKKKRGRPPRAQATKSPPAKMNKEEDEDVCFICFDGGSLVLCDRRGCPKAYHPACVKRDEAFFQSKAKWNCGWHICSVCQKAANHMCYTCTYSLCKGCIKKTDYTCVRGDKGFCTFCMKTIMLIENGGQEKDDKAQVDFDDKTSWEYLFKVYWIYLKGKLSLTLDEITQAKNPWKGASTTASVIPSSCEHNGDIDLKNNSPDMPENLEATESKRRKTDEQISITPHKETAITRKPSTDERSPMIASKDWATKELLEFVAHMKNGDTSVLSQFDVQELMLEYIKRNNLRDPRKKSQILCDSRLKILFGKPRVGHFEMLKLLEFHFFINEDLPKNKNKNTTKHIDPDWNIDNMVTVGKEKRRRNHKKTEESAPQNKLDDYAAIDVHNMNLVYLRRKLMENLIEDSENFRTKVVGSIVRIRISASDQKHDMYRLVRVVGTSKVDTPYKVGSKSADAVLEVLNLDKKETVSIDTISNQDLSEDECRRLRQSMKCGLVKRFTVGEIQDKAVSLRSARLHDVLEAETLRLNNLRDRASEKGHKKSLREYVEKLQLLKTPEERERRLREIPEVHSDPKMSPDYETDEGEEYSNKEHGENTKSPHSGISRKITSSLKKGKDSSGDVSSRSWKGEGLASTKATERVSMKRDARGPGSSGRPQIQVDYNGSTSTTRNHNSASETSTSSYSMNNTPVSNDIELDKIWHYRDPSGKMQGPFCMVQLRKWSTTGYFPEDMRIWTNREDDSLLLNDVLKPQVNGNGKMSTDKVGIRIEGLTVRTTNLSPTQKPVDHEKPGTHGFTGQPSVQNWIASGATNAPAFEKSNESNMPDLASPTPAGDVADTNTNHVSSVFGVANANLVDLPSPTPKETTTCADEKVQTDIDKEGENVGGAGVRDPGTAKEWTGYSPTDRVATTSPIPKETTTRADEKVQTAVDKGENVGGVRIPETAKEWTGYSPTDRVATTSVNMDQAIPSSSPPSSQPAWQDVRETIEFSTLAEESVSDLLAEVDAMESQNGFPSPTSRSNNFVDDLFTGSFEEFSPTPDPCSRNDAFSSSGAMIHLPFQPTTHAAIPTPTPTTTIVATSQGGSNNDFDSIKWPETRETVAKDTSDVNNSVKADERERQSNASETSHDRAGGSNDHNQGEHTEPTTTKSTMVQSATVDTLRPSPSQLPQGPQSSANGLHKGSSRQGNMNTFGRPAQEIMNQIAPHVNTSRGATVGWDHHQQTYGGDSGYGRNGKPWIRQSSFGSVSGGNGGVGVYNRAPPKGQRVCKFYESGRCKKGASCNYWHP